MLAGAAGIFIRPLVAMKMWLWFVVPLGISAVGYWQMMGIGMLVHLLLQKRAATEIDDDAAKTAIAYLVALFIIWGIAALVAMGVQ